jgi:class 3 adenylate cyclase
LARDRQNSPVRLIRFLEVQSEAQQRKLECRRVRLQRIGLIEHPHVGHWILVEKSEDAIIMVSPARRVYERSKDRSGRSSAIRVIADLAKALAEAHRFGVPHGGLTFSTLYWTQDERSLSIDLIESLLTDDLEWLLEEDARTFADDVRDLGRIIPTLLEEFDLGRPPSRSDIPILRTGDQVLALFNSCATPRQIRIERLASRADALTAADAARLPSFREWFPDEVLSPGQMVSLTTVTLMVSQIANANQLYATQSDQAACSQVLKHLHAMASITTSHCGCVIKSMNDGLNAVFPSVSNALSAAREITMGSADWGVSTKHAIHQGPALVATINDRLDYFGQTPLYVQELLSRCGANETWMSDDTWNDTPVSDLLGRAWTSHMREPLENWGKWNIVVSRYNGVESGPDT